ncbi:MAG: glycosyltransferase family 2 protein [Chloroflexi bacterium]|nr:glycosyltransferase family 2 protein [Chloroflexota bacterium]
MRISVTIPNWNGRRYLGPCLAALAAQTRLADEVLVVDSASTDGSVELVQRDYPGVRLVQLGRRPGITAAFNACVEHSSGDAIALLNNDTEPAPDWLLELERALSEDPHAGSYASKVLFLKDRQTINSTGDFYRRDGQPGNRGVWELDRGQYDDRCEVFSAMGAAALYRREALADVGLFDEELESYCEDIDWAFRAHLRGWHCRYVPRATVFHHGSATGGGPYASYCCGRNFIIVFFKNMPPALFRRYLLLHVVKELWLALKTLPHVREQAARAWLRGQGTAALTLPHTLVRRRLIQRGRRVTDAAIDQLLAGDWRFWL